eukprot:3095388-Rhodomonas_salina.1
MTSEAGVQVRGAEGSERGAHGLRERQRMPGPGCQGRGLVGMQGLDRARSPPHWAAPAARQVQEGDHTQTLAWPCRSRAGAPTGMEQSHGRHLLHHVAARQVPVKVDKFKIFYGDYNERGIYFSVSTDSSLGVCLSMRHRSPERRHCCQQLEIAACIPCASNIDRSSWLSARSLRLRDSSTPLDWR